MTPFKTILWATLIFTLLHENEAVTPLFLQAMASALATIPFTAGPMTTGLVGAKLAVGSKLLYYLGFFGRRRSKPRPPARAKPKSSLGNAQFPQGMQYPQQFGSGGFPQQLGAFNQPGYFGQNFYGYDPALMYQMMTAQGIDPAMAMQALNSGGTSGQAVPSSPFPFPPGGATRPGSIPAGSGFPNDIPSSQSNGNQGESDSDVESFFTFLRDMDDNTCISRLMCDIGANPSFLGDFSENIHGIVSTLDVQPSSGAFQYIAIMETGRREGGCAQRFPQCSDAAYEIVKNVAPTVGVPDNISSEAVNRL